MMSRYVKAIPGQVEYPSLKILESHLSLMGKICLRVLQ